jgi:hypothetical protein
VKRRPFLGRAHKSSPLLRADLPGCSEMGTEPIDTSPLGDHFSHPKGSLIHLACENQFRRKFRSLFQCHAFLFVF